VKRVLLVAGLVVGGGVVFGATAVGGGIVGYRLGKSVGSCGLSLAQALDSVEVYKTVNRTIANLVTDQEGATTHA